MIARTWIRRVELDPATQAETTIQVPPPFPDGTHQITSEALERLLFEAGFMPAPADPAG